MVRANPTSFYDRPEAERVSITLAAMNEGRTVLERWAALTPVEAAPWRARAAMAAEWLAQENGVADLGCGMMELEHHLRAEQAYFPMDVVSRDARTIVCDFNHETPPQTPASAAACLGLLEYLYKPLDLMILLRSQYRSAVVSYCITDSREPPPNRRHNAWVNDFDRDGIEALFLQGGWSIVESREIDALQRLWRLTGDGSPGPALG